MSYTYTVKVQDGGSLSMVDVSRVYSDEESNLATASRERSPESTVHFKFPNDEPGLPNIREGAEIWAGWVDDRTGRFINNYLWAGFIRKSVGYDVGPTHHIHCTCSGYQILIPHAVIKGWPTGNDITGWPTNGYPGGYTVKNWLTGGGPYPGVVSVALSQITLNIDPVFDTLIFTDLNKPGTPDPQIPFIGQWGCTTLDKILADIIGGIRLNWPNIRPIYWMDHVAAGTVVGPRFNFFDEKNGNRLYRGHFSTNPGPGDFYIE